MSPEIRTVVIILHFLGVFLMAAPFYSLVVVNERARFGAPPGYNTDRYLEQMITSQAIRCYAYLAVVLVTGLILTAGQEGFRWGSLINNWVLLLKWIILAALATLLFYIHLGLQPKITALLAPLKLVNPLNIIIFIVLIALAGLFSWRVFKTGVRYGWI